MNSAIINQDFKKFNLLGPFAWTLELILHTAEVNKHKSIDVGCIHHDPLSKPSLKHPAGYFNKSFLIFKILPSSTIDKFK